jgi:CheY-like chemotaxis protein
MSKTVLVVEDDNLTRKSLVNLLIEKGLTVHEAVNGKVGLEQALASHPDLIVTDIRMPEMDGVTMIEEVRKDEWGKNVPIIVLTTDETTTTVNEALKAGITVYLPKMTLDPGTIADQVVTALG